MRNGDSIWDIDINGQYKMGLTKPGEKKMLTLFLQASYSQDGFFL
jgi:hypothetical protein